MTENTRTLIGTQMNDDVDFGKLVANFWDHRWLVIGITLIFTILGIIYSLVSTPIYRADALIQVEQSSTSSLLSTFSEILPGTQPPSAAEIELIKSRMVLGKTVEELKLDTIVKKKYFPIFGEGLKNVLGSENEKLSIVQYSIPENLINVTGEIEVIDNDNYLLKYDNLPPIKGIFGKLVSQNGFAVKINKIQAKIGSIFLIKKQPELEAVNSLLNEMTVADKGKDTGVLYLTLTGPDPERIRNILNSISANYLLQNVERKSEEAGKSLEFLKQQLPKVRNDLDIAENKLNLYRQQNDSVDLTLEAKSVLDSGVSLDAQLDELTFKEAEISKLFTKEHPTYRALLEKRQTLEDEKTALNKRINGLPKTQQEILRLTRDVQSNQEVYMQLVSKQQELSITKASTVGNVRIIDTAATLPKPVEPKKTLIIIVSVFIGLMISSAIVILDTLVNKGIESPDQLESLGLTVYANIPLSDWQRKKDNEVLSRGTKNIANEMNLLAIGSPTDLALEALRSLRTSLHFAMTDARNNIIMISGASPAIGKTFISANLSTVVAQSGKKILLIDGDIRKGYLHNFFETKNKAGLAEILTGEVTFDSLSKSTKIDNLDFISRGKIYSNPSELLMSSHLETLLEIANKYYDLIIIDTPPILAVTDAAIIGRYAATALLVARFGVNSVKEVEISIKRFEQNGININGIVLNAMIKKMTNQYGYYQYNYEK